MPAAVAFVGGLIGGAVGFIGGLAGAIGGAVLSAVAVVGSVIGSVVASVGSVITGALKAVSSTLGSVVTGIQKAVSSGITVISKVIGSVTKPILTPIKDGLKAIDKYLTGVEKWFKATFAPVVETIELANKISGYFVLARLLGDYKNFVKNIDKIAEEVGLETIAEIARLYRSITESVTSVMEWTQDLFTAFDEKVIHADERIKEANELALAEYRAVVDEKLMVIRADLDVDVTRFDRGLVRIERRVEDLPHFMGMMIRALR